MSETRKLTPVRPDISEMTVLVTSYEMFSDYVDFWTTFHDLLSYYSTKHFAYNKEALRPGNLEAFLELSSLEELRSNLSKNISQYRELRNRLPRIESVSESFSIPEEQQQEIDDYLDKIVSIYRFLLNLRVAELDDIDDLFADDTKQSALLITYDVQSPQIFIDELEKAGISLDEIKMPSPSPSLIDRIKQTNLAIVVAPSKFGGMSYSAFVAHSTALDLENKGILIIAGNDISFAIMPDGFVRIIESLSNPEHIQWLISDIRKWI